MANEQCLCFVGLTITTTTRKCHGLQCCHHTVAGALYKNLDLKLLHSSMQTSADHRSRRRHVSHMTDEKCETLSPSGMSKVRSRPESLVAACSMSIRIRIRTSTGVTFDIPEADQVSPFSSVIRLTSRCLLRWSADVCIELCNSFRSRFS